VFVRHLLEMSGSIIANVKPDGTDGGNLKLQAAELLARDLYDYDEGKLLNASINFTGSKDGVLGNEYAGKYGTHDKAKTDHATIGQGEVKVNGDQLSAEQLQTRGVNTNVANAEVIWLHFTGQKLRNFLSEKMLPDQYPQIMLIRNKLTRKIS
jgi:hypothetical protein